MTDLSSALATLYGQLPPKVLTPR